MGDIVDADCVAAEGGLEEHGEASKECQREDTDLIYVTALEERVEYYTFVADYALYVLVKRHGHVEQSLGASYFLQDSEDPLLLTK